LLLDQGRVAGVARLARQRTGAQLALGGLMALALAAIVVARVPRGETESTFAGVASPSPVVLVAPAATPTPRPTPRPTPTPVPSPVAPSLAPSAAASGDVNAATASPAVRTYTVQSGDTLYGIAIEFGTSVEAIQAANGMGSSTHLNIGQVLTIP
jgi:nucleoid-associated protein YgaU